MPDYDLPKIMTIKEIANYLRVDEDDVLLELNSGRLHGFKVGDQWRCSDADLLSYIRGEWKTGESEQSKLVRDIGFETNWTITDIEPFDFIWPGGIKEHYDKAFEAVRTVNRQQITFKLGFGNRKVAGQPRCRVTIWLGSRAIVEFAGSNDFENDGLLASVIRLRNNSQLTPTQKIPDEYKNFNVQKYNSVVNGPRASTNMAVIVNKDDLKFMLEHAFIRASWKKII